MSAEQCLHCGCIPEKQVALEQELAYLQREREQLLDQIEAMFARIYELEQAALV